MFFFSNLIGQSRNRWRCICWLIWRGKSSTYTSLLRTEAAREPTGAELATDATDLVIDVVLDATGATDAAAEALDWRTEAEAEAWDARPLEGRTALTLVLWARGG